MARMPRTIGAVIAAKVTGVDRSPGSSYSGASHAGLPHDA
jgi:hypothetical protein